MAKGQKRKKTNYPSIYLNQDTQKYDVKYNFKEYDVNTGKNKYKAKWIYNLNTLNEAKAELAKMQRGEVKAEDKEITVQGVYDLWERNAKRRGLSEVTIKNTKMYLGMIEKELAKSMKLKNFTEDFYVDLCSAIKDKKYSGETNRSIDATIRKLINFAYKKRLIRENILNFAERARYERKMKYRTISKEEFVLISTYFQETPFIRRGENLHYKYRLLFNILYYTGMRIGECLALTYDDFQECDYYKKGQNNTIRVPSPQNAHEEHWRGMRVIINKSYVTDLQLTKKTKNFKDRTIPLNADTERLFIKYKNYMSTFENYKSSERIFNISHGAAASVLKKACREKKIPEYTCHEFRHTYISNLIRKGVPLPVIEKVSGDTQATILSRYSHMFEKDEVMVLLALEDL